MDTTQRLAEFVVDTRIEGIPAKVRGLAREAMLDGIGVTIAATVEPAGKIITDYVRDLGGTPQSTVIGGGFKTNAANAALANGTLAHCLDFDDVGGFGHPTVVLLPAILALAEKLGKSGRDALEAYCIGYEVAANLAAGNTRRASDQLHGFHSTAIMGHMSSTAAAAKLLGLSVDQTRVAFGIAASSAGGVLANLGYYVKPFHAGQAGRNSVIAAELALRGWTAAPDIIDRPVGFAYAFLGIEHFDPDLVVVGLGTDWKIPQTLGLKKYPCCYYNHAALDGLLRLMRTNAIAFDDVESAELEVPSLLPFFHPNPTTAFQGKFSYEYNLATAILDHEVVQESFTDDKAQSPAMRQALSKVRVVEQPGKFQGPPPHGTPVTIRTRSGREYHEVVSSIYGGPNDRLQHSEVLDKFRRNAGRLLGGAEVEDLILSLDALESAQIADIVARIAGSPVPVGAS